MPEGIPIKEYIEQFRQAIEKIRQVVDYDFVAQIGDEEHNFISVTVKEGDKDDVNNLIQLLLSTFTVLEEDDIKEMVNEQNDNGETALHLAVQKGDSEIVKLLLKYGADPTILTNKGESCFQIALRHDRSDILALLPLESLPHLPKKLHFIWTGEPIPAEYLRVIRNLSECADASGFELNIWGNDVKNIEKAIEREVRKTKAVDVDMPFKFSNIKIHHFNELIPNMELDPFYHQDNRLREFAKNINREMVGFKNLGNLSDFLRLEILRQEGGYYFDCDTEFFTTDAVLTSDTPPLGILFNITTGDKDMEVNNDIMGALPNHPLIERLIIQTIKNYQALDKKLNDNEKELYGVLENLTGVKVRPWTNKMDVKRYPFGAEIDPKNKALWYIPHRAILSKDAAGPGALLTVLKEYCNEKQLKYSDIKKTMGLGHGKIAGIKVTNHSDQTWLKRPKNTRYFDTDSLPNKSTLFHRGKKVKGKEKVQKEAKKSRKLDKLNK